MSVNPGVTGTFPMADTQFHIGAYAMESTNQVKGSWYEVYPNYSGMKHRVAFAKSYLGMKWTDFRRMFVEFFDIVFNSKHTRAFIKAVMMQSAGKYIPVRTGHLYDALFRSLYFTNAHWGNARHIMNAWFRWPADRPFPIEGQTAHTWPATGHGDQWGIIGMPIKYQAPNIQQLGVGPRGGVLYGLNDPMALSDPTPEMIAACIKQMQDMFRDVYKGLQVRMVHRSTMPRVAVSGGGANIQITTR